MSEAKLPINTDPLIDEIRHIRAKLDRQFGDDWSRYAEHLRAAGLAFKRNAVVPQKVESKPEQSHD